MASHVPQLLKHSMEAMFKKTTPSCQKDFTNSALGIFDRYSSSNRMLKTKKRMARAETLTLLRLCNVGVWTFGVFHFIVCSQEEIPNANMRLGSKVQLSHIVRETPSSTSSLPHYEEFIRPKVDQRKSKMSIDQAGNIVHIVHTRFMQNQPNLLDLGLARLELFREFTLRSLAQQSSRNFLWIIRVDPLLHDDIKAKLKGTLQDLYSIHHLLVASNENPNIQVKQLLDLNSEDVWSGDLEWAKTYLAHKGKNGSGYGPYQPQFLETRLDADDALHKNFVEEIQRSIIADGSAEVLALDHRRWKIWCASKHFEWQNFDFDLESVGDEVSSSGTLLSVTSQSCISAGLTIQYSDNVHAEDLPAIKHHQLAKRVKKCNTGRNQSCLSFFNAFPTALRARTPTSAGMLNVLAGTAKQSQIDPRYRRGLAKQQVIQSNLWRFVTACFGLSKEHAQSLQQYLVAHIHDIALDNYKGQCTEGHSCKESSKSLLASIIQSTNNV